MKKLIIIALCICIAVSVMACSQSGNTQENPVNSDNKIIMSSEETSKAESSILYAENSTVESSSANQPINRFSGLQLIASEGDWNTWSAKVRVKKQIESKGFQLSSEFFQIQFALPVTWEPEEQIGHSEQYEDKYRFVVDMGEQKVPKFRIFDIYCEDNEFWNSHDDKLDVTEYRLPPYEPGQDGKGPDNHISVTRETVGTREWLIYCAFYIEYTMPPKDEEMHYCNLYTIYEDAYELGFFMDIRDKTLDDPETKELILKILKSIEIVPIEQK